MAGEKERVGRLLAQHQELFALGKAAPGQVL